MSDTKAISGLIADIIADAPTGEFVVINRTHANSHAFYKFLAWLASQDCRRHYEFRPMNTEVADLSGFPHLLSPKAADLFTNHFSAVCSLLKIREQDAAHENAATND